VLSTALCVALLHATTAPNTCACSLADLERQQQALFKKLAPSVVFIRESSSFGSGFFVSADGLILTSAHVVGTRRQVEIVLHSGEHVVGEVVERGGDRLDVALVQAPLSSTPAADLGGLNDIQVGSWVGAVGHGEGAIWTFNSGMVSNIYPRGTDRPVFQTQIPLNPGNSGGPVFTSDGRVVGIVTSKIVEASDLNFAIGLDVARRALKRLARLGNALSIVAPPGVVVFVDGAMAGTGPRILVDVTPNESHEITAVIHGEMIHRLIHFPEVRELQLQAN
jgi:serine protease Do